MRHPTHDYSSPGCYFVTFVTHNRERFLGCIKDGRMQLSNAGRIVESCWNRLPEFFQGLGLDAFQIMPDHVHGLIVLNARKSEDGYVSPDYKISDVVSSLKSGSSRLINSAYGTKGQSRWQKSFADRVVRNEAELVKFREYILGNPSRWRN